MIMAKTYSFTQDNINYTNIHQPDMAIDIPPAGFKTNYTVSGTNIESIRSQEIYNVIDFNWNGTKIPAVSGTGNTTLNTTSDFLNYLAAIRLKLNDLKAQVES